MVIDMTNHIFNVWFRDDQTTNMHFLVSPKNTLLIKTTPDETDGKFIKLLKLRNGAFRACTPEVLQLIEIGFMKDVNFRLHFTNLRQVIKFGYYLQKNSKIPKPGMTLILPGLKK